MKKEILPDPTDPSKPDPNPHKLGFCVFRAQSLLALTKIESFIHKSQKIKYKPREKTAKQAIIV